MEDWNKLKPFQKASFARKRNEARKAAGWEKLDARRWKKPDSTIIGANNTTVEATEESEENRDLAWIFKSAYEKHGGDVHRKWDGAYRSSWVINSKERCDHQTP